MAIDVLGFWFLIILLMIAVFAWPSWPHTRERRFYRRDNRWRYGPSLGAALGAALIILLVWLGLLVLWWPWYSPAM
ncbi:hypothetical protein LOKVESSMR4R_01375 [Yoonia vestfoldensis]|uniref:Uncharacterized protein n=2 Tax=Yoonia vestfoldensis TaxID=245188 RepID=A0A1Y0EAN8_9RHOB|nr:hypothetical protein LOKVESSMR4R_01375 [Yoonia vestfoldensis]